MRYNKGEGPPVTLMSDEQRAEMERLVKTTDQEYIRLNGPPASKLAEGSSKVYTQPFRIEYV